MTHSATPHPVLSADDIAISVAIVERVFRGFRPKLLSLAGQVAFTDKYDGSPVTDTDMEIEVALQAALAERFPAIPVYGEETGYGKSLTGTFWLVDPIDGTKSFIENAPTFTSMAVLVQDDEAVAIVIYNPSTDVLYRALQGQGAFANDIRLDLSAQPLPATAFCKEQFIAELDTRLAAFGVHCEEPTTGSGYGFSMVASGAAAARFNLLGRGNIHDYAPGALLVHEAGGVIIPYVPHEYTYAMKTFVACHPSLAEWVRANTTFLYELDLAR
jgi:fructose-1,6-bisphosphatase/inositol monophosphatase family enzyme